MSVSIIGGGIAGLSVGYRLIELGYNNFTIFESSDCLGGLSRSIEHDGFIFDLGPHQIHTENQEVISYLEKVLKDELLIQEKKASQWFHDKFLNYPMGLNDLIFGLPLGLSMSSFLSFCKQSIINLFVNKDKSNFESWVISHFGLKMYDAYFGPYTEKVWGKHPRLLSATCAEERIAVQNMMDVIFSAVTKNITKFRNHYNLPHSPYQRTFYYPKYGSGQLADGMGRFIMENRGNIQLNSRIVSVENGKSGFTAQTQDGQRVRSDFVISTIPVSKFANMLEHENQIEKPEFELEFRSLTFVFFSVNRDRVTDNHWIYFPDKDCIFQRVSELKNFSSFMVPEGCSSVCAEIPCDYKDAVWEMEDDELFDLTISAMEKIGYLSGEDILGKWVARERFAYPTYDIDYAEKLTATNAYLEQFENIFSTGRQGAFSYINIDEVMLMGFRTAERVFGLIGKK
ncbi:MAG: FAD-dependent oxidoreductase [Thermoanaerobaculales bacterium]|nr:FAD-dependent oxidoreductase [Thermoanaerobaculales bacterium]